MAVAAGIFAVALQAAEPLGKAEVESALNAAYAKYKTLQEGANGTISPHWRRWTRISTASPW